MPTRKLDAGEANRYSDSRLRFLHVQSQGEKLLSATIFIK